MNDGNHMTLDSKSSGAPAQRPSYRQILTSLVIATAIVLQFQAFIPSRFGIAMGNWGWPFIDYPMYTDSYPAGPIDFELRWVLFATQSGKQTKVDETHFEELGLTSRSMYQDLYLKPLTKDDLNAARRMATILNESRGDDPVQAIVLQKAKYIYDGSELKLTRESEQVFDVKQ